jgi:hypothetical protein
MSDQVICQVMEAVEASQCRMASQTALMLTSRDRRNRLTTSAL